MPSHREPTKPGLGAPAWGATLVLVVILGFISWDAYRHGRHILEISERYGVTVDPPAVSSGSVTGYQDGRRSLLLPDRGADAMHWIAQTQQMIHDGDWRVRHVEYDNAPNGRDVHWASPFRWWLVFLAWLDHAATGRPIGVSVERAALSAGPVMLAVFLAVVVPLIGRKFSTGAAVVTTVGVVAYYPFYTDFIPGRADHHGLVNLAALFTVLFLLMASLAQARRWMVASGLAGGFALWISAATAVPVLIGIGAGVLVASGLARRLSDAEKNQISWLPEPGLFRVWGWAGGGVSLLAYLVEYFPSHLGLRLEINHPLYALAWVGGAEVLRVSVAAMHRGNAARQSNPKRELVAGVAGAGLVALLPFTIWLTDGRTFTVSDSFMWRLHVLYISEFQSLKRHFAEAKSIGGVIVACLPMVALLAPIALLRRRDVPRPMKVLLVLAAAPALLGWILGVGQVRWLGLGFALTLPLLAIFFRTLEMAPVRRTLLPWVLGCAALFALGGINAVKRTLEADEVTQEEIRDLVERDLAHWLKLRAGTGKVVVATGPTTTTRMIAYGGVAGLGTLYWENAEGVKHAAELFAAPSPEAAHAVVSRLGVTHIVLISWNRFEGTLAKLHRGLPDRATLPPETLIANLPGALVPPTWLRALPFALPDHPSLSGERVQIWEVTDEQTPTAAVARAVNFHLELGQLADAARLSPMLAASRDDLSAAVMLAGIHSRQENAQAFGEDLARLRALLPRADALALDERIHLAVVLAVAQEVTGARQQLQAAMRKMDEASLRHLTPGTLADVLALSDALQVEWPVPSLRRLAERLIPPAKRN